MYYSIVAFRGHLIRCVCLSTQIPSHYNEIKFISVFWCYRLSMMVAVLHNLIKFKLKDLRKMVQCSSRWLFFYHRDETDKQTIWINQGPHKMFTDTFIDSNRYSDKKISISNKILVKMTFLLPKACFVFALNFQQHPNINRN